MNKKMQNEEFISCLGSNFKQPIADLVKRLLTVQLPDVPDAPPRQSEVDYSISLVVLLVLIFEAWISRARFFDKRTDVSDKNKKMVLAWMKSLNDPKLKSATDGLEEIYFLRNAIVHNHVWSYTQTWSEGRASYSNFELDITWQSSPTEIKKIIRGELPLPSFPRTKRLNLMAAPSFVGRKDVVIVFKTLKDALKLLDELDYVKIAPKVSYVRFDGKLSVPFWSLIGTIQRSFLVRKGAVW